MTATRPVGAETMTPRWIRVGVSILALAPVVVTVALTSVDLIEGGRSVRLSCYVLADGRVPYIVGRSRLCPLETFDRVLSIDSDREIDFTRERAAFVDAVASSSGTAMLRVERAGNIRAIPVPVICSSARERRATVMAMVVVCGALLAWALRGYWLSRANAAAPLLLLFANCIALTVLLFTDLPSAPLSLLSGWMMPMLPAAAWHLAMTFPRESRVLERHPAMRGVPYAIALGLMATTLSGIVDHPDVLRRIYALSVPAIWLGLAVLWLRAWLRARASHTPLESTRARFLLVSAAGMPLVFGATHLGLGTNGPGGILAPLVVGVLLFVVPLGFSTRRYDLFDFGSRSQHLVEIGLRVGTVATFAGVVALILYGIFELQGPALVLVASGGGAVLAQALDSKMQRGVELLFSRGAEERARLLRRHRDDAESLRSEVGSARALGETLRAGLEGRGVAVMLLGSDGWQPADAGSPLLAAHVDDAVVAQRALGDLSLLHLARGDVPVTEDTRQLWESGVELVATIPGKRKSYGIVLIGRAARLHAMGSDEVRFVEDAAACTGRALRNSRRAKAHFIDAWQGTLERFTVGVAHDLGRPLRLVERRLDRMLERENPSAGIVAEVESAQRSVAYLLRTVYDMVDSAHRKSATSRKATLVEDVLALAIEAVVPGEDRERVVLHMTPDVKRLTCAAKLDRVVANLIANALAASGPEEVISIHVTQREGALWIEVHDPGSGMSPQECEQAFELYGSSDRDRESAGVGLFVSREIVEDLGGSIVLESEPGRGTRATVRIPADA